MKYNPKLSIITAVRNGAPYLRYLIDSIIQQEYSNYEHIVIDDGSNDNRETIRILESYPHIRWLSRENRGQYATQNEGIRLAQGDIIGVISADDIYLPGAFKSLINYWNVNRNCDIVYGKTEYMDENRITLSNHLDVTREYPTWLNRYYLFVQHCSLFVSSTLILEKQIFFDPMFKYAGDWDWILRLFSSARNIGYIRFPLSSIRLHSGQISRTANSLFISLEHRLVCQKYAGNYIVHRILQKIFQYRAMTIMTIAIIKQDGLAHLFCVFISWAKRRMAL